MTQDRPMGPNRYGKSGIHLAVVHRDDAGWHDYIDLEVDVRLSGDFEAVHRDGDNRRVLPTDTMRGTCFALARDGIDTVVGYAQRLTTRFLDAAPATDEAWVRVTRSPWQRLATPEGGHPHTFAPMAGGRQTTTIRQRRDEPPVVIGGVVGARVAKTTGSAFSGFLRDEYTTLDETRDRVMATTVDAEWGLTGPDVAVDDLAFAVPATALDAFAAHDQSESVQHTMHAMGWAVLDGHPEVTWIRFRLPNEHHILADLSPYGLDNPGRVFLVADRPYGVIEGVVARDGVTPEIHW